jgi:hypothetical protein
MRICRAEHDHHEADAAAHRSFLVLASRLGMNRRYRRALGTEIIGIDIV